MKALLYISVRSFVNRMKMRLRKPLTYVGIVFWVLYGLMMLNSFHIIFSEAGNMSGPEGYAVLLSFFIVWSIPMNLLAYARKRGLAFKHYDVHFVFSAPISPKGILMYAQSKTLLAGLLLNAFVSIGGVVWFHISPMKMLLFFLVSFVVETIFEGCLMLIVFGNEFLGETGTKVLRGFIWACVIAMGVLLLSQMFTKPMGLSLIREALAHPLMQLIPVIGWNIAFIRLLLIGPNTLNMICAGMYLAATVAAVVIAWRMKCTGQYFEDAMTFADEYEEAIRRKRGGSMEKASNKKKFKAAHVQYRGTGAKAIFYRQLLEYKKSRFFVLNYVSFIVIGISVIASVATAMGVFSFDEMAGGSAQVFILPGISAYITFIFSSTTTKWTKELQNPYTFLLPDTNLRKMWYSTAMEHLKAILDGSLLCVPLGLLMHLSALQIILCILIYVCLQANRLYVGMFCDGILAPLFGGTMLSLARMLIQGLIMLIGIIGAVVGGVVGGPEVGFVVLIVIALIFAAALALLGSVLYGRMESLENL